MVGLEPKESSLNLQVWGQKGMVLFLPHNLTGLDYTHPFGHC